MYEHEPQNVNRYWKRMAVPGGWLYWDDPRNRDHVVGATYVPDPTAEHVRKANGGAV